MISKTLRGLPLELSAAFVSVEVCMKTTYDIHSLLPHDTKDYMSIIILYVWQWMGQDRS